MRAVPRDIRAYGSLALFALSACDGALLAHTTSSTTRAQDTTSNETNMQAPTGVSDEQTQTMSPIEASAPHGPSGPSGVSGPHGPSGTSGPHATSGPHGPSGPSGTSGPHASSGTSGASGWLHTSGNQILHSDGSVWQARGVNIFDVRGCGQCTSASPQDVVAETKRRIDYAVTQWNVRYFRLCLESHSTSDLMPNNATYLAAVKDVVNYIGDTYPGIYVELSIWVDPTLDANELPTAATRSEWEFIAGQFLDTPFVFYGLTNEPNGASDSDVWNAMNAAVQAIRAVEDAASANHHLIAVQGTQLWARWLTYYITHPIPGDNIIYETHVYNPESDYHDLIEVPAATLPIIIGEYGWSAYSTVAETVSLITLADSLNISYTAWSFHGSCDPNLLTSAAANCAMGGTLSPSSSFGVAIHDYYTTH